MENGIYSNTELVETLIVDLNNLPKLLIDGQYIQACSVVAQMGQRLANLRNGIVDDINGKDRVIEELKQQLRNIGADVQDMTPEQYTSTLAEKDGAANGSN